MSDLYPTPTRLVLLREVDAGNVIDGINDDHAYLLDEPGEPRKVCARIAEAERAGWVFYDDANPPYWQLTVLGRSILARAS